MNKSILIAKKMDQYHTINQIKQCGFSLAADIHCEEVQGRQMLIDITNGKFYETNSIGKKVFDYLKTRMTQKKYMKNLVRFLGF